MAIELATDVVPAKKSGRKPKLADPELVEALAKALKNPKVVDGRPSSFGPKTDFDTEGKATAEARRYQKALTEAEDAPLHGQTVKVRALDGNSGDNDVEAGKFQWRLYRPIEKK